jgi:hypothetical protein
MTSPDQSAERTYLDRTFRALADGFQFSSPPPEDIASNRYYQSSDPWEVLGATLARLQNGDFDATDALPRVMDMSDDALVWNGATQLLGFACPWSRLQPLARRMIAKRQDVEVQLYVPEMLEASMAPWAVELLLELHDAAFPEGRGPLVQSCLSRLLEPQSDAIDAGPEEVRELDPDYPEDLAEYITTYRTDKFRDLVHAQKTALTTRLGSDMVAIAEGDIFSVAATAERLLNRLHAEADRSGRFDFERMRLEAATGLDCRGFYPRDWHLQKLPAIAIIDDFLESGRAIDFEPGKRYFFGHRVPD